MNIYKQKRIDYNLEKILESVNAAIEGCVIHETNRIDSEKKEGLTFFINQLGWTMLGLCVSLTSEDATKFKEPSMITTPLLLSPPAATIHFNKGNLSIRLKAKCGLLDKEPENTRKLMKFGITISTKSGFVHLATETVEDFCTRIYVQVADGVMENFDNLETTILYDFFYPDAIDPFKTTVHVVERAKDLLALELTPGRVFC